MKKTKLEYTILNKIESENVVPKSKEYFIFKNWMFMALCGISLLIAVLGLVFNILFLTRLDLDILFSFPPMMFIRVVYPTIFWLTLTIGLGLLTYVFFRNTKEGYKVERKYLWIITPILILFLFSLGLFAENRLNISSMIAKNQILREVSDPRYQIWNNPNDGRLAGEIIDIKNRNMLIVDIDEKEWKVDITNTQISKKAVLLEDSEIKIVGTKTGDNTFTAQKIMPWGQGRMGCLQENGCGRRSIR